MICGAQVANPDTRPGGIEPLPALPTAASAGYWMTMRAGGNVLGGSVGVAGVGRELHCLADSDRRGRGVTVNVEKLAAVTVIAVLPEIEPEVAVSVAVPPPTAFATPPALTESTVASLVVQLTRARAGPDRHRSKRGWPPAPPSRRLIRPALHQGSLGDWSLRRPTNECSDRGCYTGDGGNAARKFLDVDTWVGVRGHQSLLLGIFERSGRGLSTEQAN